jgi:diguanylate cyclase (GGDEF)-like protein
MQEKKFVKVFRTVKIIQLVIMLGIELTFFIILGYHPDIRIHIYSNPTLFLLCSITWVLMIFNLICLFFDFYKLRSFALESHSLNQAAFLDSLTGMPNRHSLDVVFQTYTSPESLKDTGCLMFSISNLKAVNETSGRHTGDLLIRDFCNILEEIGDTFGFVGRNGGNEFVAVITPCSEEIIKKFQATLESRILLYNKEHQVAPIELASAYTLSEEEPVQAFTQLLTITYNKLYRITHS